MPLGTERQGAGRRLHRSTSVARVENEGLDVPVQQDRAMDLGLDVVVQRVPVVGLGEVDQMHPGRDAEIGGLGGTVRIAEGGAWQDFRHQPQVGRSESRGCPHSGPPEVQRPVHRALFPWHLVVGAVEDAALPAPPVPARMRREAAVAGSRHELRAVDAVLRQRAQYGPARRLSVGVEVQRQPQGGVERPARGQGGDMAQRPSPGRGSGLRHQDPVARPPTLAAFSTS